MENILTEAQVFTTYLTILITSLGITQRHHFRAFRKVIQAEVFKFFPPSSAAEIRIARGIYKNVG
jgi:hypothetical protein